MNEPAPFPELFARLAKDLVTLPDKPEETPDTTLRALWASVAGVPLSAERAAMEPLAPLSTGAADELGSLVERRLSGVPLAHLTGRQAFMGLELLAGPEALVPRRETEILGRVALSHVPETATVAIDLCTGCGNLAIALASDAPRLTVHAADLSEEAVGLARRNVEFHHLSDRVEVHVGDLFDALPGDLRGSVDMVVCNPPYIPSARVEAMDPEIAEYEPRPAFDGGDLGLTIVRRVVAEAPHWLKPGGWLCFEIGAGQGRHWVRSLSRQGLFDSIDTATDNEGEIRAIAARRI